MENELEKLYQEYEKLAEKLNVKLNPNKELVFGILRGLLLNEKRYGKRYCPCRIEKIEENVCPCKWMKEEIEKEGRCHCGLFVKKS
jgi:ferredoxin-thioredoxin reductase catalytic subunit